MTVSRSMEDPGKSKNDPIPSDSLREKDGILALYLILPSESLLPASMLTSGGSGAGGIPKREMKSISSGGRSSSVCTFPWRAFFCCFSFTSSSLLSSLALSGSVMLTLKFSLPLVRSSDLDSRSSRIRRNISVCFLSSSSFAFSAYVGNRDLKSFSPEVSQKTIFGYLFLACSMKKKKVACGNNFVLV